MSSQNRAVVIELSAMGKAIAFRCSHCSGSIPNVEVISCEEDGGLICPHCGEDLAVHHSVKLFTRPRPQPSLVVEP